MNEKGFDLEGYLTAGVEDMVRDMVKTAVFHPAEAAFMGRFALAAKKATERRHALESAGEHIPTYLICTFNIRYFLQGIKKFKNVTVIFTVR